jgi:transposase
MDNGMVMKRCEMKKPCRLSARPCFFREKIKTFKVSHDKQFVEKLYDVVGLYLNPPDKSLVLCVDEKSQIQALDRTQPGFANEEGPFRTMTHDYKRNVTTTLFTALSMLEGTIIGDCMPRHRHQEFMRFLKKIDGETQAGLDPHVIVDNYGSHKHPSVKTWLKRHSRFHLYFIPTSSSWLNMVERWFREITDNCMDSTCSSDFSQGCGRPRSYPEWLSATDLRRATPPVFSYFN